MMPWVILFIAGLLEIAWAIGVKYTEGFTKIWPSVATLFALTGSFILLGVSVKFLPIGTAYSIWVGIGAIGTVFFGIWLFGEPVSALRLISVGFIIAGVIGLKLATPT